MKRIMWAVLFSLYFSALISIVYASLQLVIENIINNTTTFQDFRYIEINIETFIYISVLFFLSFLVAIYLKGIEDKYIGAIILFISLSGIVLVKLIGENNFYKHYISLPSLLTIPFIISCIVLDIYSKIKY